MRDHLVLGLGFVLIAINARASEPAAGGLEGILDQMEKHASEQTAYPTAPSRERSADTRLKPRTEKPAGHSGTSEPGAVDQGREPQAQEAVESSPAVVFDATRRSALADTPVAPGGLEGILNRQELKGSMTLIPPTAASDNLSTQAREKRLDERLK